MLPNVAQPTSYFVEIRVALGIELKKSSVGLLAEEEDPLSHALEAA